MFGFSNLARLSSSLPDDHERVRIPGGNAGTEATIQRMRDLVSHGKRDFRVRAQLYQIIAHCRQKDYFCYAKAVFDFCQNQIKYVFDPNGVELIEHPYSILESRVADCDSIVVLFATLCEQMGLHTQFVTLKANPSRPDEYSHVYAQVKVPGRGWVSADPTMRHPFGWTPGEKFPRKAWDASNDESEDHEMGALGDTYSQVVPYAEYTPGVMVGSEYNFRDEPSLIEVDAEQIEVGMLHDLTSPKTQADFGYVYAPPNQGMSGLGAQPNITEVPVISGKQLLCAGVVAFFLWKVIGKR